MRTARILALLAAFVWLAGCASSGQGELSSPCAASTKDCGQAVPINWT